MAAEGIGFTIKLRISLSPFSRLRRMDPLSFFLGDLRKLDLKFSRPGNLTIHDGGTIIFALGPEREKKSI